jgi:Cu-Zn family superoxide dismutase
LKESSMTKRWSLAPIVLLPVVALALSGCKPDEPAAPAGSGETPAVKTGQPVPTGDLVQSLPPNAEGEGHASTAAAEPTETGNGIDVPLKKADGSSAGTVNLAEKDGVVVVNIQVRGLTPGFHGVHLHSVGKCEANSAAPGSAPGSETGAFLSAGGHLQLGAATAHPSTGDLVSVYVNQGGSGQTITTTGAFTLDQLKKHDGGVAIVVHADADNFGNIPAARYQSTTPGGKVPDETSLMTGDAGARAACGVVVKAS